MKKQNAIKVCEDKCYRGTVEWMENVKEYSPDFDYGDHLPIEILSNTELARLALLKLMPNPCDVKDLGFRFQDGIAVVADD